LEAKNSLLNQLTKKENLDRAWNLLKKENEDSCGLSGITINDFNKNLDSNLKNIRTELKNKAYKFSPTRAAIIKKDNGNYRPLQIPEIRDRVVLKAMAILLEENLNEILKKSDGVSFAYKRGKGVREAVLKMKSSYLQKGKVILKADIINFFEEVQKDKLLKEFVFPNLTDDSINHLISESMSQKLEGLDKIYRNQKKLFNNAGNGIPQGNPLSPMLSNIYLSKFDLYLKDSGYSLIRYADDFIVIFQTEDDARKGYEDIYKFLNEKLSLKIHPLDAKNGKTAIINPQNDELSFLSIKFDGNNIYPGKDTLGIVKFKIKTIIKTGELTSTLFKEIYETIGKWIALYSYLDIERYFDDIDSYILAKLNKKFGKRNYRISKCKQLTQKIRSKQHDKNRNSFWRNPDLLNILPKFVRRRIKNST
jgi:group II intron reverse transcriptase/maturase